MNVAAAVSPFFERVAFPDDPALPQLANLLDPEWIWPQIQSLAAGRLQEPRRVRIHHFVHSIGNSALVSYEVEWPREAYLPSEYFVASVRPDQPPLIERYPEDRRLPGLAEAARPDTAISLINQYVLAIPARRASVQLIRYRPGFRAVLRHKMGKAKLYARVVRPSEFDHFLAAYELSMQSGFVVPGLAGYWEDGGVLWLTEVQGGNLRRRIRKGRAPDPECLLNGLEALWRAPVDNCRVRPFDLNRAYRRASRSFRHNLRDHIDLARELKTITAALDSFVQSWNPTRMAHNDFYDDQMIVQKDGQIALVDFEDIAPGAPMIDVGNFLAHLRWSSCFARQKHADNCRSYHDVFRSAALARFRWQAQELALREAVCLFRICTNAIRHPRADWIGKLEAGLSLVNESLG